MPTQKLGWKWELWPFVTCAKEYKKEYKGHWSLQTNFAELPNSKNNGGQAASHSTASKSNKEIWCCSGLSNTQLHWPMHCRRKRKNRERFTFFVVRSGFVETDSEIRHRAFSVLFWFNALNFFYCTLSHKQLFKIQHKKNPGENAYSWTPDEMEGRWGESTWKYEEYCIKKEKEKRGGLISQTDI